MISTLIMLSDHAPPTQGTFIVFIVTLVVDTRGAELVKGRCSEGSVSCENGDCVSRYDLCDGAPNCSDGSDEIHPICMQKRCPVKTFRCAYGACIDESAKCDGKYDCADQSDELSLSSSCGLQWLNNASSLPCREGQIQCRNGECISRTTLCDGKINCSDKSDESILICYGGKINSCPIGSFRCAYGGCISSANKCDFKEDCADGSDEHYLLCNRPKNQTAISLSKPPGRQCIVPSYIHTYFSRRGCKGEECILRPGDLVNNDEFFVINCHRPYVLPAFIVVKCSDGLWTPQKHTCLSVCKPLTSTSMIITCELKGSPIDCANEVPADTTAKLKCKDGYETTELLLNSYNKCLESGTWLNPQKQYCYYRCGILQKPEIPSLIPLLDNGLNAFAVDHPWNAGLYHLDRPSNSYDFFCGGTLISPFTVLSAAHCFVDETAERRNASNLWVSLGKTMRDWNLKGNREQKIQVANYYIPDEYAARNLSFLYDVAVIELKTQAEISREYGRPMPACLANPRFKLKRGTIGELAGWGKNHENDSKHLQTANLTYQPYEYCLEHANNAIPDDHFCTFKNEVNESISQPTVNSGDSGSGFMKRMENGNYFIYGITSTRLPTRYGFNLSTFTDVTHSNICNFVKEKLRMIRGKHENFPFSEDFPCK